MFGNTNNNNNEVSINSRAVTIYSDLSCLQLGYWNQNLSVKLNPIVSIGEDGTRKYDFEKRINTAITQDKCTSLLDDIETLILPVIKKIEEEEYALEEKVSVSYPVGKACAISVELYKDDNSGKIVVELTLYKNIKPDNTSDEKYTYRFNTIETVRNYNASTGEGKQVFKQSEFLTFVNVLKSMVDTIGAIPHAISYNNAYSSKRAQYNRGGNGGGYNQNNQMPSYQAPVSNRNDDDDMPF